MQKTIARTWQEALQLDAESIELARRFADLEDPLAAAELERAMEAREGELRALFEKPQS